MAAFFGWGTACYDEVAAELRLSLLSKALAKSSMPSMSNLYVCLGVWSARSTITSTEHSSSRSFEYNGRQVFFVELIASLETRIAREGTPLRLSLKLSKHNVEVRETFCMPTLTARQRMNSNEFFLLIPVRHIVLRHTRRTVANRSSSVNRPTLRLRTKAANKRPQSDSKSSYAL